MPTGVNPAIRHDATSLNCTSATATPSLSLPLHADPEGEPIERFAY